MTVQQLSLENLNEGESIPIYVGSCCFLIGHLSIIHQSLCHRYVGNVSTLTGNRKWNRSFEVLQKTSYSISEGFHPSLGRTLETYGEELEPSKHQTCPIKTSRKLVRSRYQTRTKLENLPTNAPSHRTRYSRAILKLGKNAFKPFTWKFGTPCIMNTQPPIPIRPSSKARKTRRSRALPCAI